MEKHANPIYLARTTPGLQLSDHGRPIDIERMRAFRLKRLQDQLTKAAVDGALLFNPTNLRYATGSARYQIFQFHCPTRCVFVPPEGKVVVFDVDPAAPALDRQNVEEIRQVAFSDHFHAGPKVEENARKLAKEVARVLGERIARKPVLAVDRIEPAGLISLQTEGIIVVNAQAYLERVRCIKSEDEITCMGISIAVAEAALARMRAALSPGITENELFAILHATNVALGGEWIDYRLVSSGGRTNPWGQESSDRMVRAGELVGVDTGLIGPFGYAADISRTFFCGPGKPTAEQRRLYRLAVELLQHNLELIRPGIAFRELSEKSWMLPDEFVRNRYPTIVHGIGMCDEYPAVYYPQDWAAKGYDGVIEENMTLAVESYIGAEDGIEGVKLEQQVVVTAAGYQLLSPFPFEDALLN
jgi:Xaa-Pro aminopeptidase